MKITKVQKSIIDSDYRYKVICAGRRYGKTYLAISWLLFNAYENPKSKCWFVSPSYRMSKNIAWQILKNLVYENPQYLKKVNESSLEVTITNESVISLKGADNYDSLRGTGIHRVVMDEFAQMEKEVWTEVIRPSLTDTKGKAMFIGTPDGFNYFYEIYNKELKDNDFKSWKFKTIDSPFIDKAEIEKARQELDEKTFRQEYEASFETSTGLVYYNFDRNKNVIPIKSDLSLPLRLSFDFNFSDAPMTTSISQIKNETIYVLETVNSKSDLHTHLLAVKEKIKEYASNGELIIYGDASKVHSIESNVTNWQIVRSYFPGATFKVPSSNPAIVDRINSVCSRIKNSKGQIKLFLNEGKCIPLMKDFEQIVWKEGKREVDKKNIELTHNSDNIGYMVWEEFPLKNKIKTSVSYGR